MSAQHPNEFARILAARSPQTQAADDAARYEAGRVEFLARRLGVPHWLARVRARHHELTGGPPELSFAAFNEVFQNFPYAVGCSDLKRLPLGNGRFTAYDYRLSGRGAEGVDLVGTCFREFSVVPFYVAYKRLVAAQGKRRRPSAMIFPTDRPQGGLVIHDGRPGATPDGFAWVYQFPDGGPRLLVEPADSWADAIREGGWRPPD